jgi:hypothetical protein
MKFCISSNINFYKTTYPKLIDSLVASGVPEKDIYFFIGGYFEYREIENSSDVRIFEVPHNSFDLTSLISVLELDIESDYWFLLHDTCFVGENFYTFISNFEHTQDTVSLTNDRLCMNIGSYSWEFLQRNKNEIIAKKNTDYSEWGLQKAKYFAVYSEDYFLYPKTAFYSTSERWNSEPIDYYGNGIPRYINHFDDIQFYKLQANGCHKDKWELNL